MSRKPANAARQKPKPPRAKYIVRPTQGAEPKKKISISLDAAVVANFELLAGEQEASLSAVMNEALASYIRERALRAIVDDGEPITDEDRESVRAELRDAGLIP
jgi:uncharacterized protein (DUF4415 family)